MTTPKPISMTQMSEPNPGKGTPVKKKRAVEQYHGDGRDETQEKTGDGDQPQRHVGVREDALECEVNDPEGVRLRLAREARRAGHWHPDRLEPDPGEQTPDEPVALLHRTNRLVDFPIDQAEVAGVLGDSVVSELACQQVEQLGVHRADWAGAAPLGDHSVAVLVALLPLADQLRDELRRVLQVGGHQHGGIGVDHIEAGRQPAIHPEVAGQLQDLEPRVRLHGWRAACPSCHRRSRFRR